MKRTFWLRVTMLVATTAAGGTVLQVNCIRNALPYLNPCGTIVPTSVCTPSEWVLSTLEPEHYRDYDPICTIPTLCGPFPPTGGGTGNNTNNNTNTGTGTNTGTNTIPGFSDIGGFF